MRIIRSLKSFSFPDRPVFLTLGNFDGLHLGHQAIIEKMVSEARDAKGIPVLFTFYKHPLSLLEPAKNPLVITPFKKKMLLLKKMGVEWVICIPFTREFANITAEEFIEKILYRTLKVNKIFTGPTYFFGKDRRGCAELLKTRAGQFNYEVEIMDAVYIDEELPSSTNIRTRILSGEVDLAHALLGRPYSIQGKVIHGTKKGSALGIHSATLYTRSKLIPADGVYAVWAEVLGGKYLAVANVGMQPTFGIYPRAIEVHILKFNRDIYGEPVEIFFLERIRGEKRFESVDELRRQIAEDICFVSANY
jgi:riboflavin kinase/FMN adenylyltransferase